MYLSILETISQEIYVFFQQNPQSQSSNQSCQVWSYQEFYEQLFLLNEQIDSQISILSKPQALSDDFLNQENNLHEGNKILTSVESQNIEPNAFHQESEETKSLVQIRQDKKRKIIKYRGYRPWIQTQGFQALMDNLELFIKNQNNFLINSKQLDQKSSSSEEPSIFIMDDNSIKHDQNQKRINIQNFDDIFEKNVANLIAQCKNTYQELSGFANCKQNNLDNASSESNSNRSLLTEILNKSSVQVTQTKRQRIASIISDFDEKTIQKRKKKRKLSAGGFEDKLMLKQFDLENYSLGTNIKPKQKKVNNVNYGQCTNCNIF